MNTFTRTRDIMGLYVLSAPKIFHHVATSADLNVNEKPSFYCRNSDIKVFIIINTWILSNLSGEETKTVWNAVNFFFSFLKGNEIFLFTVTLVVLNINLRWFVWIPWLHLFAILWGFRLFFMVIYGYISYVIYCALYLNHFFGGQI